MSRRNSREKKKAKKPRNRLVLAVTANTTRVRLSASGRVGHEPLRSSPVVSRKKRTMALGCRAVIALGTADPLLVIQNAPDGDPGTSPIVLVTRGVARPPGWIASHGEGGSRPPTIRVGRPGRN